MQRTSDYFRVDVLANLAVVYINGLSALSDDVARFERELLRLLNQHRNIIIDLQDVERLPTSSVLGVLAGLHVRSSREQGIVRFCNARPAFADLLSVTNLDQLLDIRSDVDAAMLDWPDSSI